MQVREALEHLDAIHGHLTRSEEYRGFHSAGVALAGAFGLVAAGLQPLIAPTAEAFVPFWVAVAALCAAVGGGPTIHGYLVAEDEFTRRRTRRVLAQFLPSLLVGTALTVVLARVSPANVPCLPGVWALLFGLGLLSTLPYLAPAMAWVAVFYLAAGAVLLCWGASRVEPSGWAVGGVFGPGQLAAAFLLRHTDRENDDV